MGNPVDAINSLVKPAAAEKRLDAARNPAAIRSKTGLERKQAGSVNSNEVTVQSTDGIFTFVVRVVKE